MDAVLELVKGKSLEEIEGQERKSPECCKQSITGDSGDGTEDETRALVSHANEDFIGNWTSGNPGTRWQSHWVPCLHAL